MPLVRDLIYFIVALVVSPILIFRLLLTGKWRTDWASRFGRCSIRQDDRPVVMIHAVSVGEVKAIRLLVDQLVSRSDDKLRIVISVTTDTGMKNAKQLFEPKHQVVRYPLDFSFAVNAFLDEVKPSVVALTELEVWPGFVDACHRRKIPVCVINGRLSARSFKRYRWIRPLLATTFGKLSRVGAQTRDYADRFIAMGVAPDRVVVNDTMKWDTAQIADSVPGAKELATAMGLDLSGKRPVVVAGSTAPGEDKLLIDTCPPDVQLVIVPRKPEWFDAVAKIEPGIVRRTKHPDGTVRPLDQQRFFLLDTIGELRKLYSLAEVVIVGRSFLGLYGSDMMEPIALGKPTIIGPFHSDFADTVSAFAQGDGLVISRDPNQSVRELLGDPARARALAERGRAVIRSRQGATERYAEMILSILAEGK